MPKEAPSLALPPLEEEPQEEVVEKKKVRKREKAPVQP
jgi:hypothetical protein